MIRIAHLSDLHFGKRFHIEMWHEVTNAVVNFEPDLIIVSGDLVDHPSPAQLLAARCELEDLSRRAHEHSKSQSGDNARAGELIVVPGNHDVFDHGIARGQERKDWFERIFLSANTRDAEDALTRDVGVRPSFNAVYRDYLSPKRRVISLMKNVLRRSRADEFTNFLPPTGPRTECVRQPKVPVLLALLDSNANTNTVAAATGYVSDSELIGLRSKLNRLPHAHLARIAVLHHHVQPVDADGAQSTFKGEPTHVLRNAGAVLRVLQENQFDLILHGHWHHHHFSQHALGSTVEDSYPTAVAGAGSAAMKNSGTDGNCFNLITVASNGRIVIQSILYGGDRPPNPAGDHTDNFYEEPISTVKRRAFTRAQERHCIISDLREQAYSISDDGDLRVQNKTVGFSLRRNSQPYRERPIYLKVPSWGRLVESTMSLSNESSKVGMRLRRGSPDGERETLWITLPGDGLQVGGRPISWEIDYKCTNCVTMTYWEAKERHNLHRLKGGLDLPGWDEEWVGLRVTYPMRRMILSVQIPESLEATQPYIACKREEKYPQYAINVYGDTELPRDSTELVIDEELQAEEERYLTFEARTRTWRLEIDRPMVGYHYQIRWKLPRDEPDDVIRAQTLEWKRQLLRLTERADKNTQADPHENAAVHLFKVLCGVARTELFNNVDQKWAVVLFVYDHTKMALVPVLQLTSGGDSLLAADFEVPLGQGVSGRAFLQRRTLVWGESWAEGSLIEPTTNACIDGQKLKNFLSVPIFHQEKQNDGQPPLWATIGVVTFASTSNASRVAELRREKGEKRYRRIRAAAQTHVISIIDSLCGVLQDETRG